MIVRLAEMAAVSLVIAAAASLTAEVSGEWAAGILVGVLVGVAIGAAQHLTGLTFLAGLDEMEGQ